jgi:hypothetical protein
MTPTESNGAGLGQTLMGILVTTLSLWLLIDALSSEQIISGRRATHWDQAPMIYLLSMAMLFFGACLGAAMVRRGLQGRERAEELE